MLPICGSVFAPGSLGGLLQRRLPAAAALKDFSSSKDSFIETRSKINVGAMPWPVISKTKEAEMNRSYNHVKHLVERNDHVIGISLKRPVTAGRL